MSDKIREFIEVPQQFIRDGNQVLPFKSFTLPVAHPHSVPNTLYKTFAEGFAPASCTDDVSLIISPEFLQICKAVAVGFAVMGFIGYFVKLIHIPMCVTPFSRLRSHLTFYLTETTSLCMSFIFVLLQII
jgi:protein transport protein SEC61 subunit gamma and related proteins